MTSAAAHTLPRPNEHGGESDQIVALDPGHTNAHSLLGWLSTRGVTGMESGTARFTLLLLVLSGPACWLVPPARGDACGPGTVISGEPAIEGDLLQARLEALGGEGGWDVTRAPQCGGGKKNGKCGSVAARAGAVESGGVDAMLAVGSAFRNVSWQQKSALRLVERKDYGEALQVLLRSVVVLIFPHQEVGFLKNWHQGLAMPGALYRKPRLAIGGALVLAAQCQLEIGQVRAWEVE